jgi:RecB family exonuclease
LTLTPAGRLLEQRRTQRMLARWLNVERHRDEFSVTEHEHDITLDLAGLTLTGKIDRLDRLADGTTLLIDYKTGRTGKGDWFPEPRIADPQLPAYAVSMDPRPGAIAFARIRPEDLKFDGLAEDDTGIPGVGVLANERGKFKALESWDELLEGWQSHLAALARDFTNGKASVDPRKPSDCDYCHLHALCRIQERAPYDSTTPERDGE